MTAKVFISYRRGDSAGYAGRVRDRLERELGRDLLFMDVDAIPLGTNFSKVLHEEVAKCGVLLAVIGPNWLDARDERGNRRLDDPNDWVRVEITAALQRNIPVIPILLDGATIPKADQLPEDLKELALRNGLDIRHASFQDDVNRLIRGLKGQSDQGAADGVHLAGGNAPEFPTKTDVAQSQLKGPDGLWGFLRDKRNQQVLSTILAGEPVGLFHPFQVELARRRARRGGSGTLGGLYLFLSCSEISRGQISRAGVCQRPSRL
jgi:TIR domain-containing protein